MTRDDNIIPELESSAFNGRFARLRNRFRPWGRRRVPYVQQTTSADCGAACLAMVLQFHERTERLASIREILDTRGTGVSAKGIVQAALSFGLRGRGLTIEMEAFRFLPPATILHWDFSHFVVFESANNKGIRIVDPAGGRRFVPYPELGKRFTGVCLVFEKTDSFIRVKNEEKNTWRYAKVILNQSGVLTRILSISLLMQILGLGLPVLTGSLVDRVIPRNDFGLLKIIALGFCFLLVFTFISSLMRSHLLLYLRTKLDAKMTLDFLEHMVSLPYGFFQERSAGDLMMRLNSNATIREILTSSALSGALDGILVSSYLLVVFLISPLMCAVVFGLGLMKIIIFLATRRRISYYMTEMLAGQAKSQSFEVQLFNGIETMKVSGVENLAVEQWSNYFVEVLNISLARGRFMAKIEAFTGSLGYISPVVILVAGGALTMNGHMSVGTMLAVSSLAAGFLGPLTMLISTVTRLQELGSYIHRIDDVLSAEPEQAGAELTPATALQGGIELENVTFRYNNQLEPAVRNVTVSIQPGQLVAFVGPSGAGKSTLLNLLTGLYWPEEGRILYDGIEQAKLEIRSLRQQTGVVMQHQFLFGSSIRDNIGFFAPELTLDETIQAARLARIHDDIMSMPMQYDTVLADGGLSLSGGQRQRLILARALAAKPALLFLDEATSALDAETESRIFDTLNDLNCTRIVIAHRLSTVRKADKIVFIDQGQIVGQGTHDELMANCGPYQILLRAQIE